MVILKTRMKVGPKGQVVIPKEIRDEKKICPGDEVFVELSDKGILIEKPKRDVVADFERIAKYGKSIDKVDSDKDYAEMMKQRWDKLKLK
ncbi:AbrB/MazE/SpoVT family DNA-binding domain-containing protein [Candidatus Woesearchaeota archaeon]|nr:AbrB/MazE/SpoVT family DNA-binding domain-containing protein [Candidatus Woesearchaeota archaeon]